MSVSAVIRTKHETLRVVLFADTKISNSDVVGKALDSVFECCRSPLVEEMKSWRTFGKNVAECNGFMYKSFFHDDKIRFYQDDVLESGKRNPWLSVRFIPNAKVDEKNAILWYPKIEGDYVGNLTSKKGMQAFLKEVQSFHEKGIVLGDIRRRNFIGGKFIDFDFSSCTKPELDNGEEGTEDVPEEVQNRTYPQNWNLKIDDGGRHPLVKSGVELAFLHDQYAACRAILSNFATRTTSARYVGIASVAEELEKDDLKPGDAKEIFEKLIDFLEELQDQQFDKETTENLIAAGGSGSPVRMKTVKSSKDEKAKGEGGGGTNNDNNTPASVIAE
jgi:hypothetical protein